MTTLLLLGINERLLDAAAASTGNSSSFALPARASQISWQTSFGAAPDAITIQLQVSNDNSNWTTIDSSTSTTGQSKTINTSSNFVRARINAITGGSGITVTATAKEVEQINTDSPTFTNVTIDNDLDVSGDLGLTGTLSDYSSIGGLTANKLLGRAATGGNAQLIDLGTGLSFDGTTLNAGENVAFDYIEFGAAPATKGAIRLSRHLDDSLVDGIWIPNQGGTNTPILKTRTVDDYNTIIIGANNDWQSVAINCGTDQIEVNIDLGGDYTPVAGNGVGFFGRANSASSGYHKGTLLFGGSLTETDDNQTWFGDTLHPVFIVSGNGTGSDNAGNLTITAGNSEDGQAGRVFISSGITTGLGSNGTIQITSGDRIIHFEEITGAEGIISYTIPAVDNAGGVVLQGGVNDIYNGAQLNVFGGSPDNAAGGLVLISGGICNSINNGARLILYGGTAISSGSALLDTENVTGSINSGSIDITGGNSVDGNAGTITLQAGGNSGSGSPGNVVINGGNSGDATIASGSVNITGGNASAYNMAGSVVLQTDNGTAIGLYGSGGNAGQVILQSASGYDPDEMANANGYNIQLIPGGPQNAGNAGYVAITNGSTGWRGIRAGDYKSSDGSSGVTETIILAGLISLTVKNGLITGHV